MTSLSPRTSSSHLDPQARALDRLLSSLLGSQPALAVLHYLLSHSSSVHRPPLSLHHSFAILFEDTSAAHIESHSLIVPATDDILTSEPVVRALVLHALSLIHI